MRALLVLVLGVLAACDPCSSVAKIHLERCNAGIAESCAWMQDHIVGGSCEL